MLCTACVVLWRASASSSSKVDGEGRVRFVVNVQALDLQQSSIVCVEDVGLPLRTKLPRDRVHPDYSVRVRSNCLGVMM